MKVFFNVKEILLFFDIFSIQTPHSSLSFHRRIKAEPNFKADTKLYFECPTFNSHGTCQTAKGLRHREKTSFENKCTPMAEL